MYRAMVARANYFSQDRSDIKFAVMELSRAVPKTRKKNLANLKRLGTYSKDRPRAVIKHDIQEKPGFMEVWSSSDRAGCPETRRSTSGGMMRLGTHQIKIWSTTQGIVALSSGEAGFYAIVKRDHSFEG